MTKLAIFIRRGCFILLLLPLLVFAGIEGLQFDNPTQEALYTRLIKELRCLVCQNQNLADSNAELAKDLRLKTYDMVKAGKTGKQIADYMTQRYGDFVLYNPPMKQSTWFLWLGPFAFLLLALVFLVSFIRNKSAHSQREVTNEQLALARQHLDE